MTRDIEHLLMYYWPFTFLKKGVQIFWSLFNQVVFLLLSSLCIMNIHPLIVLPISFPILLLTFLFLMVSIKEQNLFKLKKSNLSFKKIICAFCVYQRNICLPQGCKDFLLYFLPEDIVLAFIFRSTIHFKLIPI